MRTFAFWAMLAAAVGLGWSLTRAYDSFGCETDAPGMRAYFDSRAVFLYGEHSRAGILDPATIDDWSDGDVIALVVALEGNPAGLVHTNPAAPPLATAKEVVRLLKAGDASGARAALLSQ